MRTLRLEFRPDAWRSNLWPLAITIAGVVIVWLWGWWRGGPTSVEWFSAAAIAVPIELARLATRRLRRSPSLEIGPELIESSFAGPVRRLERGRVREVRFDAKYGWIEFWVPDGVSMTVEGGNLDPGAFGTSPEDIARACSNLLDVPLVVKRGRRREVENGHRGSSRMSLTEVRSAIDQGKDLGGVDLSHLNLRLVKLDGARLDGAKLRGRWRPSVIAGPASLWHAVVDDTERTVLERFSAEDAKLAGADLTWAQLRKGHLRRADLRDATVVEADVREADLREADLRGTDFTDSAMDGADLRGALWDESTKWPAGLRPPISAT